MRETIKQTLIDHGVTGISGALLDELGQLYATQVTGHDFDEARTAVDASIELAARQADAVRDKLVERVAEAIIRAGLPALNRQYEIDHARTFDTYVWRDAKRDAAAAIEALKQHAPDALLREARDALAASRAESGHCMCGDPIESHNIDSGHAPVDSHLYMVDGLITRIDAALKGERP